MKKLSDDYFDARDLLLQLLYRVQPVQLNESMWLYERRIAHADHNYQRDREVYKGIYIIYAYGYALGRLQAKPHATLKLYKSKGQALLYRNVLERAARDNVPGIRISYTGDNDDQAPRPPRGLRVLAYEDIPQRAPITQTMAESWLDLAQDSMPTTPDDEVVNSETSDYMTWYDTNNG